MTLYGLCPACTTGKPPPKSPARPPRLKHAQA
jgi:hypothetical protein